MGSQDSNLSSTGFDYVVAVTQDSINGTLEEYLYSGLPEVILCYVYNDSNQPVAMDFATFVGNAGGTDPFTVPDGTDSSDPRVQDLNNAYFAFAVKAKLGLPPGVPPASLPPIIALKPGQSNVTYTLMFSEFVATELVFGPRDSMTWVNQAQPSGTCWSFTGAVDLDFQDASFTSLPADAQQRLKDVADPDMFGVRQLYYDLNSSDLEQGFRFDNVPTNSVLNAFMTSDFIDTYWKALGGSEVLGYAATQVTGVQSSSLAVTDLNFFTPDAVGSTGAPLTLNYLCATGGDALPGTTSAGFGWNWIEAGETSQFDGVAALNRNAFADYLLNFGGDDSLAMYIQMNCLTPYVQLSYKDTDVYYDFSMDYATAPKVDLPPSGDVLITTSYQNCASDSVTGPLGTGLLGGSMTLSTSYDMAVGIQDGQLVAAQRLIIYVDIVHEDTGASGNIVDKEIVDVYSIGVDDMGQIVMPAPQSLPIDLSQTPGQNGFLNWFTKVNQLIQDATQYAQNFAATNLTDVPVSAVRDFVFPGGSTFVFKDAAFSANQDLVGHITYADPT